MLIIAEDYILMGGFYICPECIQWIQSTTKKESFIYEQMVPIYEQIVPIYETFNRKGK